MHIRVIALKMAFDVNHIKFRISKVCRFLVSTSFLCLKNYPVIWFFLLYHFVVYMFFHSIFISPIYSLPIVFLLTLVFRFIVHGHQKNLKYHKGERNFHVSSKKHISFEEDLMVDERKNSSSQPQSVRRRNANQNDKRCDIQEEEDTDVIYSTIYDDPYVNKVSLVEEDPREIREVEVDRVTSWTGSSSAISLWCTSKFTDFTKERTFCFADESGRMSEVKFIKDAEDKEEEEAQIYDKRNLMNLGISEMETNKRLESLIARRKARKLLSMQVRKTLLNMGRDESSGQIASIVIPRHSPFPNRGHGLPQDSPTPGSAPSILLPSQNPFDIPYDPQEEKPILTGGSFHQEFTEPPQKDVIFCRHESFCLGDFSPSTAQEVHKISRRENLYLPNFPTNGGSETHEYSRFRNIPGDEGSRTTETCEEDKFKYDKNSPYYHAQPKEESSEQVTNVIANIQNEENTNESLAKLKFLDRPHLDDENVHHEQGTGGILTEASFVENDCDKKDESEVHTEIDPVKNASDESSSSSSSEVNVPFTVANRDIILKSLSFSIRKNITSDKEDMSTRNGLSYLETPLSCEKKIQEDGAFYPYKGFRHAHSFSIASDLQVEVSEEGSPRSTVDESISISYIGEDDEDESRSRSEQDNIEGNVVEVSYSSSKLPKSEDYTPPVMLSENVGQEDPVDSCLSSTGTDLHMDN